MFLYLEQLKIENQGKMDVELILPLTFSKSKNTLQIYCY